MSNNISKTTRIASTVLGAGLMLTVVCETAFAQATVPRGCNRLPTQAQLRNALATAVATPNGGLNNNMWAAIVNFDGVVCAVAFSGANRRQQWLLSRVIAAQKAYTANGLSLSAGTPKGNDTEIALSTANLNTAVNPGGSLYGLQHSNPVDTDEAYQGNPNRFGRADDPMVGETVGGVNVFGGGLGLYRARQRVGAVGVSGDTSCADHVIAWRVRDALGLDSIPGGVASGTDNIIYDLTSIEASPAAAGTNTGGFTSPSGFGHPTCLGDADGPGDGDSESLGQALPATNPIGP